MDDDEPKKYVNDDESEGIHSKCIHKELEDNDPVSRAKTKEILEPLGFIVFEYESNMIALAEEAKERGGQKAYESFLKEHSIENEYRVPDLIFKGKNGLWGYLELEILKKAWDLEGRKSMYPYTIRYPNRKHHFSQNPKYEGLLWYCQFCSEDMDLHHIFSFEAMRLTYPVKVKNEREPSGKEIFRVIPEGWHYENALYTWNPNKAYDKR